ncbi:MAG TPA: TetR/AcrR family transcriptional regulator [Solirubrobacterales bacterium]|nr:TetR/AcrR family transcriptional regulator [Solirubrobacterales bacterium]
MARTRRSADREARREELLRIAAGLFAERGYEATTVRDIASAAGILSGSLYHHFDSKEAMVDAILAPFLAEAVAGCEAVVAGGEGPRRTLEGLITAALDGIADNRDAILIFQNEAQRLATEARFAYLGEADRKLERIWTDLLRRGSESGELRADLDPTLTYRLIRDSVWSAPRWYSPGASPSPERIADQYVAVLVEGVASR